MRFGSKRTEKFEITRDAAESRMCDTQSRSRVCIEAKTPTMMDEELNMQSSSYLNVEEEKIIFETSSCLIF